VPTYLIATDLSPSSRKAARVAARLAGRTRAELDYFCALPADLVDAGRVDPSRVRELLEALAARREDADVKSTAHVAVAKDVPGAILHRAEESRASLVVVAPHGATGWKRVLLGSVALKVLRGAKTSVLVARDRVETARGPVLAGVDLGSASAVTLRHAVAVARAVGADLDVVHVVPPFEFLLPMAGPIATLPPPTAVPARELALRVARIPHRGVRISTRVLVGSPAETIVGEARRGGARLVVVGATTKSRARAAILGNVAQAVAGACGVSVLVVRGRTARGR
jgi:nucleotide-binding universal stress UspA family protein